MKIPTAKQVIRFTEGTQARRTERAIKKERVAQQEQEEVDMLEAKAEAAGAKTRQAKRKILGEMQEIVPSKKVRNT